MFVVEVSVVCGVVVCGEMPTRFVVGWDCRCWCWFGSKPSSLQHGKAPQPSSSTQLPVAIYFTAHYYSSTRSTRVRLRPASSRWNNGTKHANQSQQLIPVEWNVLRVVNTRIGMQWFIADASVGQFTLRVRCLVTKW